MISRTKTIAILTLTATLLAAGSAFAVKTMAPITPAMASEATCPATASDPTAASAFDDRWNGMWRPVNSDFARSAWANCSSGWAFGYVGSLDLSTLPIMR